MSAGRKGDSGRVSEEAAGERLDKFVASLSSVGSRRRAREAIDSGKVLLDGRRVGPADRALPVSANMRVEIEWNRPGTSRAAGKGRGEMVRAGLGVIHEDADLLVVDKPAGLLTDAATHRQRTEEHSVKSLAAGWLRTQGDDALIVHRIDRDTSGLVVLARNPRAQERLRAQFSSHRPTRVYLAFVSGGPEDDRGQWAHAMRWDSQQNLQRSASASDPSSVMARASYRVLERFGSRACMLEVQLETGRRNQIRLHCQLAGYPIVGERQYISRVGDGPRLRAPRQSLHAHRLVIVHPTTGATARFESPLPPDLKSLAQKLRRRVRARRTAR